MVKKAFNREFDDAELMQRGGSRPDGTAATLSNPGEEDAARKVQSAAEGRENAPLGYEQDVGAGDHSWPGIGVVKGAAPARGTPGYNPATDGKNMAPTEADEAAADAKAAKLSPQKETKAAESAPLEDRVVEREAAARPASGREVRKNT